MGKLVFGDDALALCSLAAAWATQHPNDRNLVIDNLKGERNELINTSVRSGGDNKKLIKFVILVWGFSLLPLIIIFTNHAMRARLSDNIDTY